MIAIRVTTLGDAQEITAMIAGIGRAARDIGPALPRVVSIFRAQMRQRFETEGAGGPSGPWKGLSPRYGAWKARHFPGRKILFGPDRRGHEGGALMRSLTTDGAGSVVEYGPNRVFIGSTLPYAEFHQTGTATMPRRAPIEPSDRDVAQWTSEIWRYFNDQVSKVGWKGRFQMAMT